MAKLTTRRNPVFSFLERKHPLNRHFGMLRHKALSAFQRG